MWRKSWCDKNLYGSTGNGCCSKRKLLPDERSVWDDYLDLAALSPIKGQVCITHNTAYTLQQLSEIFHTPLKIIERANRHLEALQMITLDNKGIIVINNWDAHQSEYDRLKVYKDTQEDTSKDTLNNTPNNTRLERKKEYKYIRKELKNVYKGILEHWNSKGIIRHKVLTEAWYKTINGKIDAGFTLEELCTAIDNYAYILRDKSYFWSYRWTLDEFLHRGLDKFLDIEVAKENYKNRDKAYLEDDLAAAKKRIRAIAKEEAK